MLEQPGQLAAALDALNEPTFCVQWANVERRVDKMGPVYAHQIETHKESLEKLIRAVTKFEEETAEHFVYTGDSQIRMQLFSPTVVLGTPELYVYDAVTGDLTKTASVIVRQTFDAIDRIHTRYVDIVTEDGLPEFIDRYRRAAEALRQLRIEATVGRAGVQVVHDEPQQRQQSARQGRTDPRFRAALAVRMDQVAVVGGERGRGETGARRSRRRRRGRARWALPGRPREVAALMDRGEELLRETQALDDEASSVMACEVSPNQRRGMRPY